MSIAQLIGRIYPSEKFSIGLVPREKKGRSEREYDRGWVRQEEACPFSMVDWLTGVNNIEGKFCSTSESPNPVIEKMAVQEDIEDTIELLQEVDKVTDGDYSRFYKTTANLDCPLFIKRRELSRKRSSPYGSSGITRYGRRVTENCCILLTKKYHKENLGFGTCTLPSLCDEALKCLLANWSNVVRRFFQKIKRAYEKVGSQFIYVGCTEIQPNRFINSSQPVPHLHFVFVSRFNRRDKYTLVASEDYLYWNEAVNEVLHLNGWTSLMGEDGHVGSLKIERIKTSAASYLGKYISKGSKEVKDMQEAGYSCFPKQWWFACMHCKKLFKESILTMSAKLSREIFYHALELLHACKLEYCTYVKLDIEGREVIVGAAGAFPSGTYNKIMRQGKIVNYIP